MYMEFFIFNKLLYKQSSPYDHFDLSSLTKSRIPISDTNENWKLAGFETPRKWVKGIEDSGTWNQSLWPASEIYMLHWFAISWACDFPDKAPSLFKVILAIQKTFAVV